MKAGIELKQSSVRSVVASLQRKIISVQEGARQSVDTMTEKVFQRAQSKVSIVTGKLRDSGFVSKKGSLNQPKGIIGYSAPHAIKVHERPSADEQMYKWLERTLLEAEPDFLKEITMMVAFRIRAK